MRLMAACLSFSVFVSCATSKSNKDVIQENKVTQIETVLSADDMKGRSAINGGAEKAALFIAGEMKNAGLQNWKDAPGYLQKFQMKKLLTSSVAGVLNGKDLDANEIICISSQSEIKVTGNDAYTLINADSKDLGSVARRILNSDSNYLVLVDTNASKNFKGLKRLQAAMFDKPGNSVFVLTPEKELHDYSFSFKQSFQNQELMNVVGWLPGKSKPNEYVVFSGHYDHLGISKPDEKGDSIYNGANDDASGVTATLSLANYYSKKGGNERSLIFIGFTAEELGGFGSNWFSRHLNPADIVAMFNIEMIGTESKWGKNSAYITGFDKSDFGSILQKNVKGSPFSFYPDPYPAVQLFYRSDNATLARLGVPAHTITTSKMDNEPHYHKPDDEVSTLDLNNMTSIIKAIATGASSIVNGTDTPSRIGKENQ